MGLGVDGWGRITRGNFVFAKICRPGVARHFLGPARAERIGALVASGKLTAEEGRLARQLPVAEDFTVESDSGGHTDNRPLSASLPTTLSLRNATASERGYRPSIPIGAGGRLGSPGAVAAARDRTSVA